MFGGLLQVVAALGVAGLLLVFLVWLRLVGQQVPDREIREVETLQVAVPPPPPPDIADPEPPPPPPKPVPRLEVNLDQSIPPIKATLNPEMDFTMKTVDFDVDQPPPPEPVPQPEPRVQPKPRPKPTPQPVQRTTFNTSELDTQPRLLNSPSATYPSALARRGVKEGRVVLEVSIDPRGRVSVRRVLSASHQELVEMAQDTAGRARFSTPTKNGRPVTAIFQWPMILRQ